MKMFCKRFLTISLALAMAFALALPTFASGFRPNGIPGYYLNINGAEGSAYEGRSLNMMKTSSIGDDQDFKIGTRAGYDGYYMLVTKNVNYAVNRSDYDARAIIWPISTGFQDSRLYDNDDSVIRLYSTRELLTAREPVTDWSPVYFGGSGITVWIKI